MNPAGGSGRGHRGGNHHYKGGQGPNRRPYNPMVDRYCPECGDLVFNQGNEKPARCPKTGCRFPFRFRNNSLTIGSAEMIHCGKCDIYVHKDDNYCTLCKWANSESISRKRRISEAIAQREAVLNREKIRKLEEELQVERALTGQLKEEVAKKEEEYMAERNWERKMLEDDIVMGSSLGEGTEKPQDGEIPLGESAGAGTS